jgi:hypothetical protein
MKLRFPHGRRAALAVSAVLLLGFSTGCQAGDAVLDGVFGGISDTVATVLSSMLLGVLQPV